MALYWYYCSNATNNHLGPPCFKPFYELNFTIGRIMPIWYSYLEQFVEISIAFQISELKRLEILVNICVLDQPLSRCLLTFLARSSEMLDFFQRWHLKDIFKAKLGFKSHMCLANHHVAQHKF